MAFAADRVRETTTTAGTGVVTLLGAVTLYQPFSTAFVVGDTVYYCIAGTSGWEVGVGTLVSSTTISRDTVFASSNSGALVSFGSETKDIFCTQPAHASKWPVVQASVLAVETLTIMAGQQLIVHGNFANAGAINNNGDMVIL